MSHHLRTPPKPAGLTYPEYPLDLQESTNYVRISGQTFPFLDEYDQETALNSTRFDIHFLKGLFDGNVTFDEWLNLKTTTRKTLRYFFHKLNVPTPAFLYYLSTLGLSGSDLHRGQLAGKIIFMMPVAILREMQQHQCENIENDVNILKTDIARLFSCFHVYDPPSYHIDYFTKLLADHSSLRKISWEIVRNFFKVYPGESYSHAYVRELKNYFCDQFVRIAVNQSSTVFLTGLCSGFLTRMHIPGIPYHFWNHPKCLEPLNNMCGFIIKILPEDRQFLIFYLKASIFSFYRTGSSPVESLLWHHVARYIYRLSLLNLPIVETIDKLMKYEEEFSVKICIAPKRFTSVYEQMALYSLPWAKENLQFLLTVKYIHKVN